MEHRHWWEGQYTKTEKGNLRGINSDWGGAREGAGRKPLGETRKVSMTLEQEEWIQIDELIENKHVKSVSDYFRQLHLSQRGVK